MAEVLELLAVCQLQQGLPAALLLWQVGRQPLRHLRVQKQGNSNSTGRVRSEQAHEKEEVGEGLWAKSTTGPFGCAAPPGLLYVDSLSSTYICRQLEGLPAALLLWQVAAEALTHLHLHVGRQSNVGQSCKTRGMHKPVRQVQQCLPAVLLLWQIGRQPLKHMYVQATQARWQYGQSAVRTGANTRA
jgi:hypothetical protein